MRSKTLGHIAIFGVVATVVAVAACGKDTVVREDAVPAHVATPAVAETASTVTPTEPAPQLPQPVDAKTAAAAWTEGVARFHERDYTAASEQLAIAVAGKPDSAYRRYLLGLSLWKSGDSAGSEAALVESAKLDSSRVKTWINLARVRNERGDRTGALDAAGKAIEIDPSSADALHQKGRALMELKRGDEALAALTSARELDPESGYVANTLGLLLIQLGRPGDAIEPLEAAKSVLPKIAFVRNNLGVAYERMGRIDEAKLEYVAAVDAGDTGGKAGQSLARLGGPESIVPAEGPVETASTDPQ